MTTPRRPITLRLDQAVVTRIDEVRRPLRMNRSTWLRKAVARNLRYNTERELPVVASREIQSVLMPESV
jgi:predicted transcriptional regulator